jgi:hypothetical protein
VGTPRLLRGPLSLPLLSRPSHGRGGGGRGRLLRGVRRGSEMGGGE